MGQAQLLVSIGLPYVSNPRLFFSLLSWSRIKSQLPPGAGSSPRIAINSFLQILFGNSCWREGNLPARPPVFVAYYITLKDVPGPREPFFAVLRKS